MLFGWTVVFYCIFGQSVISCFSEFLACRLRKPQRSSMLKRSAIYYILFFEFLASERHSSVLPCQVLSHVAPGLWTASSKLAKRSTLARRRVGAFKEHNANSHSTFRHLLSPNLLHQLFGPSQDPTATLNPRTPDLLVLCRRSFGAPWLIVESGF